MGPLGHKEHSFDDEFGKDVTTELTPGKAAVIAEVLEESEPPVNNGNVALGGVVSRWSTDQRRVPTESPDAADLDGLGVLRVKIEDAIDVRRAKADAHKQIRERWVHLLEEQGAQARRRREEQPVARVGKRHI